MVSPPPAPQHHRLVARSSEAMSWRLPVSIAALFTAQFATAIVPFGVGALAPFLRAEYGLQRSQVGLATATIFLAVAVCSVPAGSVTDTIGVARALLASCAAVALGAAGVGVLHSVVPIAVSLLLVGVGYSLISPATNSGVIAVTPTRLRGRMMGVKQMGVTVGGAVAAATLPLGVQRMGITNTMLIAAGAVALLGVSAALIVARTAPRARSTERTAARPRPDAIVRRRVHRLGAAVGGMVAAQHVVATYLTLFLVDRRDMTGATAAALLTLLHLSGTAARLGWGWVSDRAGSRLLTMATIGATSFTTLLALATVGATLPGWGLIVLVIVLGAATQGGNAVYQVAIAEEDLQRAGWASGVGMAFGFMGAIVAPPVFGTIVDQTGSYPLGLVLAAAVVALAVATVLHLARPGSAHEFGARPGGRSPIEARTSR
jgi:ACS family hexuronate transporter-like MFS transporter